MKKTLILYLLSAMALVSCITGSVKGAISDASRISIIIPQKASRLEVLAAREIRRYLYLRMGVLPPIARAYSITPRDEEVIVIAGKGQPLVSRLTVDADSRSALDALGDQQYLIKTLAMKDHRMVIISGCDATATLYGAYRFAELIGVRFYLHGDEVPDERLAPTLPVVAEQGRPLFRLRGIQPFHDFPEGPDWWNLDDYKGIFSQLPKLRMNFFGLHTYPEGGPNAEPTTWIGMPSDIGPGSQVKFSYPSSYQNTLRGNWGYSALRTSDFVFGSAALFDRDAYGSAVMMDHSPEPMTLEACNTVFDRTGLMLKEALRQARLLGIKTCVGTETPLTIPKVLKERMVTLGKDPAVLAVQQELYEGIFRRIMQTYELDYYWLWTPENWTWQGASENEVNATTQDLQAALSALRKIRAPFQLATCGWVLGPQNDRALFDKILPKEVAVSCINREVGMSPIDPAFGDVQGRPKWAIPWLEDDPALTSPQLWVGRMRRDAAAALRYGCEGLMGIHWRTRVLGPAVSALAQAAWDQKAWQDSIPDPAGRPRVAGPVGGRSATFPEFHIEGSDESALYQTLRVNMSAYRLSIPNGSYTVTLKFSEPQFKEPGRRLFGVKIQGTTVLEKLDIFAKAGFNKAFDHTVRNVKVDDGWLDIDFLPQVDVPAIAAIAVEGPGYIQRINCGDGQVGDYQNDLSTNFTENPSTRDFYRDWASVQFGPEISQQASRIFERMDSSLPRPSDWVEGPGGLKPDVRSWDLVSGEYSFVDELAALRSQVRGAGSLDRFDYWLNNFRYMQAMARVRCVWAEFNRAMERIKGEEDTAVRKQLAKELALPLRIQLVQRVRVVFDHLLAVVSNSGELGTVANWNQHILPGLLTKPGEELALILGEPLPPEAMPSKRYSGPTRVVLPTLRSSVTSGEQLKLRVIILSEQPPPKSALYWRELGDIRFDSVPLVQVSRGVSAASIPAKASQGDGFEYYVEVLSGSGEAIRFPATAPVLNQTVVVEPR